MAELRNMLAESKGKKVKEHKLKPIDIKNIEKPTPYDNNIKNFDTWYERFGHLLVNCSKTWKYILKAIVKQGKERIGDTREFMSKLDVGDQEMKE
eukprot:1726382-Lingulodinium_polyedra.AAC.1